MQNLDESFEESDGSIDGGPPLEIIRRRPVWPRPDQFLSESEADDDDSVDNPILPPLDDDQIDDGDIDIENMPDEFVELNYEPKNADYEHDGFEWSGDFDAAPKPAVFYWARGVPKAGPSPAIQMANFTEPAKFVEQLLTSNIVKWIVDCTNEYAKSKDDKFEETNETEMKAFFAALIYLGVKGNPPCRRAFSSDAMEGELALSLTFPCNRFEKLRRFIHFDKISVRNSDDKDKLSKIRVVFELLVANFQAAFICSEKVTVDEAMIPYRGRTAILQYMKNKPCKYGMKVWALCDAATSYLYNAEVYSGKVGEQPETNQAFRVASQMMEPVLNCGRTLYCDNFYTSPRLLAHLLKKKTYCVGTVRHHKKGVPREIVNITYQPGAKKKDFETRSGFLYCKNPFMTLVKYEMKPKKFVYLLSSLHGRPQVSSGTASKPKIVLDYNKCKGGVDTMDMLAGYPTCTIPTKRWPFRIFCWLLDVTYLNAFIIYKECIPAKSIYEEQNRRSQFLIDASRAFLRDQIAIRIKKPAMKHNTYIRNLVDTVQNMAKLAIGRKKVAYEQSIIDPTMGTLLRSGRTSRGPTADQAPSTSFSMSNMQMPPKDYVTSEAVRKRKYCQMSECTGRRRKASHFCQECKAPMCAGCILQKIGRYDYCINCAKL